MQDFQMPEQPTTIESLVMDMRLFLQANEHEWWKIFQADPNCSAHTLRGFAFNWKGNRNLRMETLIRMEKYCRCIDPAYMLPDEMASAQDDDDLEEETDNDAALYQ